MLDPLPLVVRDLPDQASQDVVAAYDRATLFDPQPSRDMLIAVERAIPVPSQAEAAWNAWILRADSSDPAPFPDAVLDALRDDPRNGDRLSNLAVAICFTVLTEKWDGSKQRPSVDSDRRFGDALLLLGATLQAFRDSRAPVLNYAFLSRFSLLVSSKEDDLAAWSEAHPEDVTALQLLVSGHLPHSTPISATTTAQLNRLAEEPDPRRAALGHALLGDLKLSLARSQRSSSPFAAQQTARQALEEYDQALALTDDTSVYSARAVTLEFLGLAPAAIETQQRAVELDPGSVPLRVLLAEFVGQQEGEPHEIQAALREARETGREALAIAANQQAPLLRDVQIKVDPEQHEGHRRDVEYSAFRPARAYLQLSVSAQRGAGYIITFNGIPKYEREPKVGPVTLPAQRAAYNAIIASVILGDPQGVTEDTDKLLRLRGDFPGLNGPYGVTTALQEQIIPAAQLVADSSSPSNVDDSVVDFAAGALRYAGLYWQAATLCRSALDRPGITRSNLLMCIGENAYLAGEFDLARQTFAELFLPHYEGFVAAVAGDTDDAVRLYRSFLSDYPREVRAKVFEIANARLADVYLDSGDEHSAIELYDKVIERLQAKLDALPEGGSLEPGESMALQHSYNNRGVARLKLQTRSGSAPDCEGEAANACAEALADFEAALRSDPYNPVYLLGKAWAERLLGDSAAAVQTLNQAVQVDPALFPALNDLGVLAAQSGDLPRARQAFEDALAANPTFDLALWNLGVLEMQRGVSGVPRGQAYLARAIAQNPAFATSALSFRTDEEIYRVEFNERVKPGAGWSFASATSIATSALGFFTVLVMMLRVTAFYLSTNKLQESASKWAADAARLVDQRFGPIRSLPGGGGWNRWLPLLITLPALAFVTSWSARREAPGAAAASVFLALFAALTAVVAHETGHTLVAMKLKVRVRPAQWGPGALLALILLPFNLNTGPFPGQRVVSEDERAAWWVYLAGPMANLLIALGAYALFLVQPLPGLRLIALVQLVAMSYALLPFEPLDGAALSRSRPKVVGGLAFIVLIGGLLFSLGVF